MSKIGFHIVRLWCAFLSVHPFWLLYLKSDFYCFVTYHLIRYRRKVVRQNLLRSFPEKSENEIKAIEKRYYHTIIFRTSGLQDRIAYFNQGLSI